MGETQHSLPIRCFHSLLVKLVDPAALGSHSAGSIFVGLNCMQETQGEACVLKQIKSKLAADSLNLLMALQREKAANYYAQESFN